MPELFPFCTSCDYRVENALLDARELRKQPAGTLAKRAKLAARLHNQERIGWDSPARGIAAFTAADWQPNQNLALPKAHRTYTVFHGFA